ncbi:hypothetical protein [Enterococcus hirae]
MKNEEIQSWGLPDNLKERGIEFCFSKNSKKDCGYNILLEKQ